MNTYIILLRGINVSGKNKILMQNLRDVLTSLGYQNVKTYIQSGNIILDSDENKKGIVQKIKDSIFIKFGYEVAVLIRTVREWENIINQNPYHAKEEKLVAFVFLNKIQKETTIEIKGNTDEYIIIDDTVYIYCKNGFAKTKLMNNIFEKKLKVTATTRNFRTTKKLLELATN